MASYKLIRIEIPAISAGFVIETSHTEISQEIAVFVSKMIPGAKFETSTTTAGEHQSRFLKLNSWDRHVAWEVVRYLCDQGWEPFQVEGPPTGPSNIYLRHAS